MRLWKSFVSSLSFLLLRKGDWLQTDGGERGFCQIVECYPGECYLRLGRVRGLCGAVSSAHIVDKLAHLT